MKKAKKFYCHVRAGRKVIWGYREAQTDELALSCFIQDEGISEKSIDSSFATTVDRLLVDRLLEYIPEDFDPWGCETPFTLQDVEEVDMADIEEHNVKDTPYDVLIASGKHSVDRIWHASRVLWLVQNVEMLEDPISVDNHCHYGRIYPTPEIIDGWHRFFAHRFLGKETIPSLYSGRTDLRDYLAGKRKSPPED